MTISPIIATFEIVLLILIHNVLQLPVKNKRYISCKAKSYPKQEEGISAMDGKKCHTKYIGEHSGNLNKGIFKYKTDH